MRVTRVILRYSEGSPPFRKPKLLRNTSGRPSAGTIPDPYDLRVLSAVWPEVMYDLAQLAKVLGEYLGEDHDPAVAGSGRQRPRREAIE